MKFTQTMFINNYVLFIMWLLIINAEEYIICFDQVNLYHKY